MASMNRVAALKPGISKFFIHVHLRANLPSFPPRRSFHVSPRRLFLDACFVGTHAGIDGLHSLTGLSWVVTLPLTALIVRGVLIAPLTVYGHKIILERSKLTPLMNAWSHVFVRKVMQEHAVLGPVACAKIVDKKRNKKLQEFSKDRGIQLWKASLSWLQLPIWLVVIETVRKMCGTTEGLLGLLIKTFGWGREGAESSVADGVEQILIPIEQSFATEGALWFPNLLLPDPMLILPFMLSGTLFANLYFLDRKVRQGLTTPSAFQRRLRNALKILALAIGPLTLQVPTAMLVYWISSSLCALGQNLFMDWYMPQPRQIKPCKPRQTQDFAGLVPKG